MGVSRLAEYTFETSALADELASNEPRSEESLAAEESLVTDTAELDPKDAYSILYGRIKEGCAAFFVIRQTSCASRPARWGSVGAEAPTEKDQAGQ